ncbi:sulfite exporter TauE/SafE family protein [Shouchella clausii]|uniref:sulfite exporter TauE/SafE family protein n=2 Tax=Shouchella clausii TaxID=79880 RepID=UPI002ACEE421|nr:sulfite exporter TauE/SafE family protein [Shouchella clausii]
MIIQKAGFLMEYVLLVLVGFAAAAFGSLLGLGGGVVVVPALLGLGSLFAAVDVISPQTAAGTSLFVMIFTGISSVLAYHKQKTIDWKSALLFLIGIVPGAILGTSASKVLSTDSFMFYFGLFMLVIAGSLFLRGKLKRKDAPVKGVIRESKDEAGNRFVYGYSPITAILVSIGVGFLSSLFGVGGGALMVPVMIVWFGFPAKIAAATAMLVILFSAVSGSAAHFAAGHIHWLYALALIPGAWFGGKAGAWLNQRIRSNLLVWLMKLVFIGLAVQFILQGLL